VLVKPALKVVDVVVVVRIFFHDMLWCQNADYMTAQVFDLTDKLEQSEAHLGRSGFVMGMDAAESSEDRLTKATKDRFVAQLLLHSCYSVDDMHKNINIFGHFLGLSGLAGVQHRILTFTTVCGALIITGSCLELNVEQCRAVADPQTKPTDLGSQSACRLLLSSPTVASCL